jgi:uncharacterized protein (DUF433 family)
MATAPLATIAYPHISKTPGVCGGKACIDSTRIRVMDIVGLHQRGLKAEDMRGMYGVPLSLAEIYAALSYYYDHRDEIEASFVEDERWETAHERTKAEYLAERSAR